MANAKKCDICGQFYEVSETHEGAFYDFRDTSMVRVLRRNPTDSSRPHDVTHFDACDNCLQDTLDYILSRQADATEGE